METKQLKWKHGHPCRKFWKQNFSKKREKEVVSVSVIEILILKKKYLNNFSQGHGTPDWLRCGRGWSSPFKGILHFLAHFDYLPLVYKANGEDREDLEHKRGFRDGKTSEMRGFHEGYTPKMDENEQF